MCHTIYSEIGVINLCFYFHECGIGVLFPPKIVQLDDIENENDYSVGTTAEQTKE